ncbi:hypothetical protein U1Q18_002006, partial [Sarracenia purpurea var. burkii]
LDLRALLATLGLLSWLRCSWLLTAQSCTRESGHSLLRHLLCSSALLLGGVYGSARVAARRDLLLGEGRCSAGLAARRDLLPGDGRCLTGFAARRDLLLGEGHRLV